MSAFRCAIESEVRGDSMLGTAPPQTRVLLVHQPGPWGPRGLVESRCDPDVARRIDVAAAKMGMRLQTIRRPGKHVVGVPDGGHDVGIAETRGHDARVTWWRADDLATMADELEAGWPASPPASVETAPIYLVCAHGRHDACCALFGRRVARALEDVRPGRVWETTHLGGDRFAANLLVLPSGELYGRVPPADVGELVTRTDAGEVVAPLMRGRIGMPPIEQAALVYAHDRLGIAARDALRVVSVDRIDARLAIVHVEAPSGPVTVAISIDTTAKARLSCRGPEGVSARSYRGVTIGEPSPVASALAESDR